jgi:murein DD-endopeptidase MepM/ murein hydrolase activator NlpD
VWIHPLLGPTRRMPLRGSRLFGAERLGDRPSECLRGHCGVDLGGKLGEPVLAVHDGVVDKVQRASNSDHGGHYVRIAHRDGNIFSQYFHLGPIPRTLQPGTVVKAGDVIGYVGMTGVKRSGPHLHFTMAIQEKPGIASGLTRYVDPEPLVALWPVRLPAAAEGEAARLSAGVPVGVARGFTERHFRYGRVRHGGKAVDRAD